MKKQFLILLLIASFQGFSQPAEQPLKKTIKLGVSFSPDYSSVTTKEDDGFPIFVKDHKEAKFGYTTGVNVSWGVNHWLALDAGLHFANKGYKSEWIDASNPQGELSEARWFDHFYYLDIPITAKFFITKKKFSMFASLGLSPSIFLDNKYYLEVKYVSGESKEHHTESQMDAKSVNLVMLAGIGVDYAVTNRLSVRIEPVYRRSLTAINGDPTKFYLWSAGANVGLYVGL